MDLFEVRSLLSFDVSIIEMYLIISFLIISILNILVANNKLVYNYWSITHMYLYVQKLFSSNWCIYITYFFICTYKMSFIFGLLYFGWFFSDPFLLCTTVPIKIYSNAEDDKSKILSENKNKSGIYVWKNINNGKQYIGSAIDLSDRLSFYYSNKAMENYLKNYKSYIYSALLKHGYSNFSLTILEYCSPEQCLEREDFYLSFLPHVYNILQKAGSRIGSKHSDDTKTKISDAAKKIDHPGRFKTGENHPNFGKKVEGSGRSSQAIEVTDVQNNTTTCYDSIREVTRELNIPNPTIIIDYIKNNRKKPYKGKYIFKKI